MKKRKRAIYFLSFLPGLGHYYLGLMNRGLQFMLLTFGTIFMTDMIDVFGFFLPIIVFYSYFDALQYYNKYKQDEELVDEPIIKHSLIRVNKSMIGWILIGFGGLSLLENSILYLERFYEIEIQYDFIKNIVISAVFVVIGVRLLRGKKEEV